MSDDVSNKEELKDLLGVQSNKPRRHNAQPHESSLGKGLSAELFIHGSDSVWEGERSLVPPWSYQTPTSFLEGSVYYNNS
jgi:hypothetical protein